MRFPHILFLLFFCTTLFRLSAQEVPPLKPCPKSPNCICTLDKKTQKRLPPLSFKGNLQATISLMKQMILTIDNTELITENSTYLHFEFSTTIGHFIDDVEFYFDREESCIHIRSASRKGYGDFGANRRRLKKISEKWNNI